MRPRTTKELAKRIDLEYYRAVHPWWRWRRNASVGAAALAGLWLTVAALRGDQQLYNSGPVAVRHALFGAQCRACHVPEEGGWFWLHAADQACVRCHEGPVHHENQGAAPACASCHVEHKGHVVLADLTDAHCTRCHRDLAVTEGTPKFAAHIDAFTPSHPEFALLNSGARDGAQVKLNHAVHLKPGLRGPNGSVQMVCADCHRPGAPVGSWLYGAAAVTLTGAPAFVRGAYMNRITYADHCIACHPLGFDPRTTQSVPHDRPEAIRGFLRLFYLDYAAAHPDELRGEEEESSGLRRGRADEDAMAPEQWIAVQVAAAEELLYRTRSKGCQYCHVLEAADSTDLPRVMPTKIPQRWFAHARFDHRTHRELRCVACHERAATSRETADVLLPGIAVCRKCHREAGGARATCVECHTYHDKTRERPGEGPLTIPQMISMAQELQRHDAKTVKSALQDLP